MQSAHRWRLWTLAAVASALALASVLARLGSTGVALRLLDDNGTVLLAGRHADLNVSRIDAFLARAPQRLRAEWSGQVEVPRPGFRELILKSDGSARVEIDGAPVLGIGAGQTLPSRASRRLSPGEHRLEVSYAPAFDRPHEIFLKGVTDAGDSVPFSRDLLSPEPQTTFAHFLRSGAPLLSLSALLLGLVCIGRGIRDAAPEALRRRAPVVALGVVVIIAAALRFEALTVRYWGVDGPDLALAIANSISSLRPGAFEHAPNPRPYEGDPFSYLMIARSMTSFYEPSVREPLFPALTAGALRLMGGNDIGINLLSALASTLTCIAIYFLGTRLGSRVTGLIAAALFAIEWQVISLSVEGWRDDLFTLLVTATAAALISLYQRPTRGNALALGLFGGLCCLTRLSALTFLIPGIVVALVLPGAAPRKDRGAGLALGLGVAALLAGPFMVACAIGFGDPFYAVNAHARFYRLRAGLPESAEGGALGLLATLPLWAFVETGFSGLTSFPFSIKWSGLNALVPHVGDVGRWCALLGLPVLLYRVSGLLTLTMMFGAIVPYAWTWNIVGGGEWRFTLPAYPFYLVSAALAIDVATRGAWDLARPGAVRSAAKPAGRFAVTAFFLWAGWSWTTGELAWLRIGEAIRFGRPTRIDATSSAKGFFPSGWMEEDLEGGAATIVMSGRQATLRVPSSRRGPLRLTLRRIDPREFAVSVEAFAGARSLGLLTPGASSRELMVLLVPEDVAASAASFDLTLISSIASPPASPLRLLWIRVEPQEP